MKYSFPVSEIRLLTGLQYLLTYIISVTAAVYIGLAVVMLRKQWAINAAGKQRTGIIISVFRL